MAQVVEINNNKELAQSITNSILCLFTATSIGIKMMQPKLVGAIIGNLLTVAYDTHCDGVGIDVN